MKIYKFLSEEEVIEVIDNVARKQSTKPHGVHGIEDLRQHVKLLCWKVLPDFDPVKQKKKGNASQALENWLSRIAKNRLINLYRDTTGSINRKFKKDTEFTYQHRKGLMEPIPIDKVTDEPTVAFEDTIDFKTNFEKIKNELSQENLDILDAVLSGEKIPAYYRKKLLLQIQEILNGN